MITKMVVNGFVQHVYSASGQLECLKYAHENGCVWDKWIFRMFKIWS